MWRSLDHLSARRLLIVVLGGALASCEGGTPLGPPGAAGVMGAAGTTGVAGTTGLAGSSSITGVNCPPGVWGHCSADTGERYKYPGYALALAEEFDTPLDLEMQLPLSDLDFSRNNPNEAVYP